MAEVDAPPGIDNLESWPGWFVGRESELARLDAAVTAGGPVVVAAVHGLGGIGKSSLAAYWVGTRPHGFAPIVWIHANSPEGVEWGLARFAARLQPTFAETRTVEDLAERGLQWLATHTRWLLILDNVENPADIVPVLARARTGRVLITGRLSVPWQPGTVVISLNVLDAAEAEQLLVGLVTAAGPRDLDGASELCKALGYLPLAIEQAGAYLAQQRFTTLRAYLQLLQAQPGLTLDRAAVGTDPQRTIARIWQVTLDRIAETDPDAVELLRTLSWYAPDNIPLTLCHGMAKQATIDAALGILAAYNMITPDTDGAGLSIHRLVQSVARTPDPTDPHRAAAAIQRAHNRAAETLRVALPDHEDPGTWSTWRAVLPHIDAITGHPITSDESITARVAMIRSRTGLFLSGQGMHASAITHHKQALADFERFAGPDHPNTLTCRNNLAYAYELAGRTAEAIPLYEQTLASRERVLGVEHLKTLLSRNNLAYAYQSARRLDAAIPLYERTLTDRDRALGPDHPDTLTSRNNLAYAYELAGQIDEAISLFERTLTDTERVLGPDHPDTLGSRNNLANVYESAGRTAEAIPLFEQALADRERVLGPDHPDTLTSRNNLASAYQSAGRTAEAIPLYERTLADFERALGPNHPNTLTSRNNLASAYQSAGRTAEAIPLYERTLAERDRVFGSDHPDTLGCQSSLGRVYESSGRIDEAISLLEQAFAGLERVLGPGSPKTGAARNNLAVAYRSAGQIDEAIPLFERTVADCERVLGPDHPDTLTSRNNLASAYESAGRTTEAISLLKQVIADFERVLGPNHPNTLTSRNNLAVARKNLPFEKGRA
ncbi:tetratricopeptide repeat protein [Nocardia sp. NPDC024068]|uniref:tetratricopeptide repeat protein n=1 Tax=Nocardia sp. NPDC024068 TaxID=3157197 RepID=UPI0033C3031C